MNKTETRADHIDRTLNASSWGADEGRRVRREYRIAPGRIEGHGKRGQLLTANYVQELCNTTLAALKVVHLAQETFTEDH